MFSKPANKPAATPVKSATPEPVVAPATAASALDAPKPKPKVEEVPAAPAANKGEEDASTVDTMVGEDVAAAPTGKEGKEPATAAAPAEGTMEVD